MLKLTKGEQSEHTIHGEFGNADVHLEIDHKGRMFFMSSPKDRSSKSEIVILPSSMVERVMDLCLFWLAQQPEGWDKD